MTILRSTCKYIFAHYNILIVLKITSTKYVLRKGYDDIFNLLIENIMHNYVFLSEFNTKIHAYCET